MEDIVKFSIIIPVFKVENYLADCVSSVVKQTYANWELVLVDDGSPDRCPELCDEYECRDKRIKVVHKTNGGLSSARNAGLDVSAGQYVLFLDSDDFWKSSTMLEEISSVIIENNPDIIIYGMTKYYPNQDNRMVDIRMPNCKDIEIFPYEKKIEHLIRKNVYSACACDKMYKREVIEKNRLRFKEGFKSEDVDWCAKLLMIKPNIYCLNKNYYVYRQQNEGSITATLNFSHLEDIIKMIEENVELSGEDDDFVAVKHYLARYYVMGLTNVHRLKKEEQSYLMPKLKEMEYILQYDWSPWVRKVNMVRWAGLRIVMVLLGWYLKYKRV